MWLFFLLSKLFLSQPAPASSQSCTATSHSRMAHGRGKKWIFTCNIQLSGSSNSRRSHNIYISDVLLQLSNPLGVNMQGFKVWGFQFTSCLWGQSYRDSVGLLQHDIMYSSIKRSLSFYREINTLPQKPIRQNIEYDRKFRRIQQSTHCCALDLRHSNASGRALLREQSPLKLQAQFSSTDWKLEHLQGASESFWNQSENKLRQLKEKRKYKRRKDVESFPSRLGQLKPHYGCQSNAFSNTFKCARFFSFLLLCHNGFLWGVFSALWPLHIYLPKTIRWENMNKLAL